ncbi:Gfo/Idh/MocA family protein [Flavobacterium sp. ASW18X]|uniref:Gfo/Idh/MocA family protein n=1 Tax=Flavobacterium sp. ASW18X TaxID=2572595 RepID=UPI0010AE793C|nr:Gfo/Idh/MocA family oxidoreductase [Flavobacterium sp. ASW18X]TKD65372.1 Gfo/Idh/MocA family oxidoreductase [Flavobacterium sp. ASW18X]
MQASEFFTHKPIRWGIVGCGAVTEVKSGPPYQFTSHFELRMVMRRDAEKVADYAKRHQVPAFTTKAEDLINSSEIDAIYIATPPHLHKKYALKVAEVGKPCCIEKPLAPSYKEGLEIYEVFEKKNIPLFVAYYRRSLPRFLKVKEWLDSGAIGRPRHIHWLKTRNASFLDKNKHYNWRTDANIAPAGYFDDLASHGLDLFCFLLGDIILAKGIAINQQGLYTAKDAISGVWEHANGVLGTGTWNFATHEPKDEVVILGENGEIRFSVLGEEPVILKTATQEESLFIPHPKHVQEFHVHNIQQHLLGILEHPSTGKTALHTSWVMDKILGAI